jgi:hypothetical protein
MKRIQAVNNGQGFEKEISMRKLSLWIGILGIFMMFESEALAQPSAKNVKPKVQYRGFTVCSLDQNVLEDAVNKWNANQVRYMMCPVWWAPNRAVGHYQATWKKILDQLPAGLDRARALGLAVVLDLHQIPNDNPKEYSKDGKENSRLWWYDPENLRIFLECWKQVAEICKDRDQVIWFDLLNEPCDDSIVHSNPSYPPTSPDWYQKTIDAIRKIDTKHPVVIETGPGMLSWGFTGFPVLKDPCQPVIYSTHPYQPVIYSHQGVNDIKVLAWPGKFNDNGGGWWDRKRLEVELAPALEFQKKHNVRIYAGEFSAPRWAPNAADFLRDCIEVFEKNGWDWNYHSLNDAGIWRLEEPNEVDLYNKEGKYVKTALANPKEGLFYAPYGTPEKGQVKKPEGLTDRGQVLKHYLDRNVTTFRKVLIIGNSITRHGPSEAIGWPNDCGMAATSEDKDFAHVLFKKICDAQPKAKPELQLGRITTEAAMKGHEHLLPCKADLIVIELGDNYRGKADEVELQKPYEKMIADLRKDHSCRVICVSAWGNTALNPWIKKAADNQGAQYVDISHLFGDVKNRAASEGHFKHDGVNWHPGNRGMNAIAETVWKAIKAKKATD